MFNIDHIVGNVEMGKMNEWVDFYSQVLGFSQILSNDLLIYTADYPGYDLPMIPIAENTFFNRFFWTSLIFERDSTGKVIQVYWKGNPEQKGIRFVN